ncbi:MAG: hypothetical protein IPJ41_17845 [Phycisphaerales bacterium]|nr:hypothetical protein [Phycisphaerales bacterium]
MGTTAVEGRRVDGREWMGGVWNDGKWKGGVWHDGEWNDGEWYGGEWMGGEWHGGLVYEGPHMILRPRSPGWGRLPTAERAVAARDQTPTPPDANRKAVPRTTVMRWLAGTGDLTLTQAEAVARSLGLELTCSPRRRRSKKPRVPGTIAPLARARGS